MTDNQTRIAGNFHTSPVPEISVYLDEGAITVASGEGMGQRSETFRTRAAQIEEGDWVALSNDALNTFANLGPLPLVEHPVNGESLVMFEVVTIIPSENVPANTTAADSLTKRIAGKFLRKARVRVYGGITAVVKAQVMANGTNATVPGVPTTLNFNITSSKANHKLCFDSAAANGAGVVPLHACAAGTDGDLFDCEVGITSAFYAVTGA